MEDNQQERDEALIAFHEECDIPTRADVERWVVLHPKFAHDIREHAAVRLAMLADTIEAAVELDDDMIARAGSRVQAAMFAAEAGDRVVDATAEAGPTLNGMLKSAGLTQPELARRLPIKRVVVADLFAGRMRDLRPRFSTAISRELGVSVAAFNVAHAHAARIPALGGRAKSVGQPVVNQRTFEEIIRSSGMSEEEIAYWLADV
ncbi:helix-turn-helix transcriptional regulator [Novosphingobium resinovorum]|uniref:helix-turn-helix domain-containing protein n=1 Tax=Novosphingobium resinovorum TaxID=158500 RepID=UPI002ED5A626|nr:helix-turn-helix transcriptional regulator [Novosphingobium resinovorum]